MFRKEDETYMRRALALAKQGVGRVNPNPLVGCVIVKEGRIIGEGWHRVYGELHAERDAIRHLTEPAAGADLYVTLEPCCHTGKQPPCTEAILEEGIRRVFVGSTDPNPLVAGKGIERLRAAGVEVKTGLLKTECDRINRVFFHFIVNGRPYVVYKYAMSMDGKTASVTGKSKWISNEASRRRVQEFRNELSAILVGSGTALADDPMLSCRLPGGRNPVRVLLDGRLRVPETAKLFQTAGEQPTILFTGQAAAEQNPQKCEAIQRCGVTLIALPEAHSLQELLKELGKRKIDSLLLEGGGTLAASFAREGLINEARVFVAPMLLGGSTAPTPLSGQGFDSPDTAAKFRLEAAESIEGDMLLTYLKN